MRTTRSRSAARLPPLSLILKWIRPSRSIHSSSVFGRPSSSRVLTSDGLDRIAGADRMKHRQSLDGLRADVSIEILASERRAEISCEIARDEGGSARRIGAQIEGLAVGIVEGGIERAGDDERAQLRNRLADGLAMRRRGLEVGGLEHTIQIQRMAALVTGRGQRPELPGERFHRVQTDVLGSGRKGPGVAQRHRPETRGLLAVAQADAAGDVQNRHPVHGSAAEHVRRAIRELLERVADLEDAQSFRVRGSDGGPAGGFGARAECECRRDGAEPLQRRAAADPRRAWSGASCDDLAFVHRTASTGRGRGATRWVGATTKNAITADATAHAARKLRPAV